MGKACRNKKTFYYTFIIHGYTQTATHGKLKVSLGWFTKLNSNQENKVLFCLFGLVLTSPVKTQLN